MKKIAGTKIDNKIYRYDGVLYQTNHGFLLNFCENSHTWIGIFPGVSWDEYYDNVLPLLSNSNDSDIVIDRMTNPTMIWPFKPVDTCQYEKCNNNSKYEYCSIECWYRATYERIARLINRTKDDDETIRHSQFLTRLELTYGPIIFSESSF